MGGPALPPKEANLFKLIVVICPLSPIFFGGLICPFFCIVSVVRVFELAGAEMTVLNALL